MSDRCEQHAAQRRALRTARGLRSRSSDDENVICIYMHAASVAVMHLGL